MALLTTTMSMIKPVYAPLALLALPMLARLRLERPLFRPREWLVASSVLLPAIAYPLWTRLLPEARRVWMPSFAHPNLQMRFLFAHPGHILQVFIGYFHYFIDDHTLPDFAPRLINGKWTTVFGGFGTAEFEMALPGYLLAIAGLLLALGSDVLRPGTEQCIKGPAPRLLHLGRWLAAAGAVMPVPLTVIALYLVFSHVGSAGPYGVQGRYHLPSMLLVMLLGVHVLRRWLKFRWAGGPLLAAAAAAAM